MTPHTPGGTLSFRDTVRARHSCRSFSPTAVDPDQIRDVLEDARWAPSNCNIQPWDVHIASGNTRDRLSSALLAAHRAGQHTPDFSFDEQLFHDRYGERRREHGAIYYSSLGIAREDLEGRRQAAERNLAFFGAPHVALLFMPSFGDNVRVASDLGMYAQTFLLALAARGLAGVPQTILGFHADVVRRELSVPDTRKFLLGISFGFPTETSDRIRTPRDDINATVTLYH